MNEPLLNYACLGTFKLIKVCVKTWFFVFYMQSVADLDQHCWGCPNNTSKIYTFYYCH